MVAGCVLQYYLLPLLLCRCYFLFSHCRVIGSALGATTNSSPVGQRTGSRGHVKQIMPRALHHWLQSGQSSTWLAKQSSHTAPIPTNTPMVCLITCSE